MFNFFKKTPDTLKEKSTYTTLGNVDRGSFTEFLVGGYSAVRANQAMRWYGESSAISIPVDRIAQDVEQIRPVILTKDGEYITDHEILNLINNPNGFETRDEFIGQVCRHWLLTHDSLVYAEGSVNTPPASLWAVKPHDVNITENGVDGYPSMYGVTSGMARGNYLRDSAGGKWLFTQGGLRQVYQIRGFSSSSSNTYSDSPLGSIALEIRQTLSGRYHNLQLLENGGRLSLVAVFREHLDEDQLEQRRAALNENFAGPRNAGKIAVVTSEDLELKEAGTNNKDMDFATLDKVASETIMRRYNVPLVMMNTDSATFNNMKEAVFHYYDGAVLPTFQKCYSGLSDMLMPRYGLDPAENKITYNPDDIEALRMRRIEELSMQIKDKAITINEYRDGISREPVEGGDDIYESAAMVPIARDVFTLTDIDDPELVAAKE